MMKKLLGFAAALLLVLAGCAAAWAEDETAPVTVAELSEWAAALKEQALAGAPLNDPADDSADTEDGYLFRYDFGALYADRAEMTGDTRLAAAEVTEEEDSWPRGTGISMTPVEVAALFPCDNPDMAGDRDGAVLYMRETGADSLAYGLVYRDGQRISALAYGEIVPEGNGYRAAELTFLFEDGLLYEARAEGLLEGPEAVLSAEDRDMIIADLKALDQKDEYAAVRSSRDGMSLTEFGEEDLVFSGIRFLSASPDEMPGETERDMFDNEDGSWIMTVTGSEYEAVFRCDENGGNASLISFTITGDTMEGPRGVRRGDAFHEDMQRFRFESRGTDGISEVLYGKEDEGPRGTVQYVGDDGIALRYVAEVSGGRTVELLMRYDLSRLNEIIVHVE